MPCKITFFTWTPALCKILTIGNLWKRHMVIWVGVVLIRTWRDSGHLLPFCFVSRDLGLWCFLNLEYLGLCQVST